MNFLNKEGLILLWSHIQEFVNSAVSNKADKDYVDEQIAAIPTPDVSGQINDHNTDEEAHADIRAAIAALEGSGGTGGGSVQPDWEQNDETAPDYIKNKPDENDALEIIAEMGLISPIAANDGSIYTDENGVLYTL